MFKSFVLVLSILTSFDAFSQKEGKRISKNYGPYIDLAGGYAVDGGSGSEKLLGSTYQTSIGYRWSNWAFEIGYTAIDLKAKPGVANDFIVNIDKATLKGGGIDFIIRTTFWRFLTFGLGYSKMKLEHDFQFSNINNDPSANFNMKDSNDYTGAIAQIGLVLPLWRFLDLRLMYELRTLSNDDYLEDDSDNDEIPVDRFGFQHFSGHLVWYFL